MKDGLWGGTTRAMIEYQTRPLDWIVEVLEVPLHTLRWSLNPNYLEHEWDGDQDPIIKILEAMAAGVDCGVESATGTGKTFVAACIVLWFLACFENALVITSAPKETQLLTQIWMEIGRLFPKFKRRFPDARILNGKIRMRAGDTDDEEGDKESWTAIAFVCGVGAEEDAAQKAAGFHRADMLIVTEDTPGIKRAIMNAFGHTRTDDHNLHLALGNPDHQQDSLHQFCFDERNLPREGVTHVRISALDHPNIVSGSRIVPGAIGPRRLAARTREWGKGTRLYQSRIRGISPSEAEDSLIRWAWCVAAAERFTDPTFREGPLGLGVDVANSENGDKGAIARGQGACCTDIEDFPCPDASVLGEQVYREASDKENPVDPRYIGLDSVGVGAATANKLRERGMKVRWISGGSKAIPGLDKALLWSTTEPDMEGNIRAAGPAVVEAERFDNLRSQVWWRLREDLRLNRVALPFDEALFQDLCTPTYRTNIGKIEVESKEEIVKRLRRSPNKGDAVAYWNFVRFRGSLRPAERPQLENLKNQDRGLERQIHRRQKIEKVERKNMVKLLNSRAKLRQQLRRRRWMT